MAEFSFDLLTSYEATDVSLDGVYFQNTAHAVEAISHLIDFFKYGPRNQEVLKTIGLQLQELEDMYWAMYHAFDGDTAVGDQLDILGRLVGEKRQGRVDDDFRAAVKVRILVNISNGTIPELLKISETMVPTASVLIAEVAPMTIQVNFSTLTGTTLRTVFQILRKAKAGGVRLLVTFGGEIGAVDGSPAGGEIGAVDGSPAGFIIGGGT